MSEELDDIVDNLKEPSAWIRIVFMIAFATVLYVIIAPVILVLMVAQALFSVFNGSSNNNLRFLGAALNKYVYQILEFISYNSEEKPFPFSDFPQLESSDDGNGEPAAKAPANSSKAQTEAEDNGSKTVKKKAASKKTAAKKSPAKKKVAKAKNGGTNGDENSVD